MNEAFPLLQDIFHAVSEPFSVIGAYAAQYKAQVGATLTLLLGTGIGRYATLRNRGIAEVELVDRQGQTITEGATEIGAVVLRSRVHSEKFPRRSYGGGFRIAYCSPERHRQLSRRFLSDELSDQV